MFSSRLRLLSTGQSQQLSRYFSVKKPEPVKQPQGDSGSVNLKPRRNILPIATYDGQGATNGYFIALLDGSKKHAVLAQLEGCDYTITHDFPETLACFSGLLPLPSICVCVHLTIF